MSTLSVFEGHFLIYQALKSSITFRLTITELYCRDLYVFLALINCVAPGEAASLERSERIQRSTGTNLYSFTGFALQKQGFKVFGKQAYCFSVTAALLSAFIFL
jgi:hypothetical protein